MKTQSAKAKGRNLQKYVAGKIREFFGLSENDVKSTPMGSPGRDILMSDKAFEELPVTIECKNTKKFPSIAALEQSEYNTEKDTIPAVVWKPFGKGMSESIIYMNFEKFLLWYKKEKE